MKSDQLKVLSFNIHKGFDLFKRNYRLDDLKEKIKQYDFDIVFLQELHGLHPKKHANSFDLDPLEHFADQIWHHYAYGKNASYSNGHHGNAILSKYPIIEWENYDLSNHDLEQRGLLYSLIDHPTFGKIHLFCTHFDLTQWGRNRQLKKLFDIVSEYKGPQILAGDFNDWNSKIRNSLEKFGYYSIDSKPSFPSVFPFLKLDCVYYQGLDFKDSIHFKSDEWRSFSDHIPIGARFLLDKAETKS